MTQEDKELLAKDLCARLPYGVIVKTRFVNGSEYPVPRVLQGYMLDDFMQTVERIICKPYLRLMTSMTEEEIIEFNNIPSTKNYTIIENDLPWSVAHYKQIDWLNKNHFDYRGLIHKGLAVAVTRENNPYKN